MQLFSRPGHLGNYLRFFCDISQGSVIHPNFKIILLEKLPKVYILFQESLKFLNFMKIFAEQNLIKGDHFLLMLLLLKPLLMLIQ